MTRRPFAAAAVALCALAAAARAGALAWADGPVSLAGNDLRQYPLPEARGATAAC